MIRLVDMVIRLISNQASRFPELFELGLLCCYMQSVSTTRVGSVLELTASMGRVDTRVPLNTFKRREGHLNMEKVSSGVLIEISNKHT